MNERLKTIREKAASRAYKQYRQDITLDFAEDFKAQGLSDTERTSRRLRLMLEAERPVVLPEERIAYIRTVSQIPAIHTKEEWDALCQKYFIFDGAKVCNISSDYETTIREGFAKRREEIINALDVHKENREAVSFLESALESVDAVTAFARRYHDEAVKTGNREVTEVLANIPESGAKSFHEALQFFRILNFTLWINGNHHITVGRFDQYMYPYYKKDIESGKLTREEALELIIELFLSLNKDSDLYHGVQQGDNGQSMVLGGVIPSDGSSAVNELTELCLNASLEVNLIDPKINLRVNKNTPDKLYELGTLLTKQGLGFPQYENDDTVIPALVNYGYSLEDARDYAVAACWEFIIPKKGMDIPNVDALNFPQVVNDIIHEKLTGVSTYEELFGAVKERIFNLIDEMLPRFNNMYVLPSSFQSVLMEGCVESGQDISKGLTYNNYGVHGVGVASAADALAAVKSLVFEEGAIGKEELLKALDTNFEGCEALRQKLVNCEHKMGNNDAYTDSIGSALLSAFADSLEGKKNERGGIYRAGTGTAMYYIWFSSELPATADGRKKGEPLSANFSPALNINLKGPLSVIQSFGRCDVSRSMNGGPLTLEIHDTVFRNEDGIQKVAQLVKAFISVGGHQMQLNAISRDTLLEAQRTPEKYKNLIVRVWGWSGYFVELDRVYQDHIIKRVEFTS